ncbi:hypothetical protein JCM19235_3851 [Vibrio maritimus]|uniref:Uncharacterized protein n=1 Tax=Vibrio maritimus TaxID=990268 RepID=A0A090S2W4_9VIBR|nr:hypothetical protein JCM19235_3851 [Vibrio maritimus]
MFSNKIHQHHTCKLGVGAFYVKLAQIILFSRERKDFKRVFDIGAIPAR